MFLLSALLPASLAVAAPPVPVRDAKATYDAAMVAAKSGDLARATALCREVLKTSPNAAPVWATLARILSEQDRHTDAIAAAREAIALSPKFAPFHADLADFYLRAGRRTESEAAARKALALDPRNDVALTTLATCSLAARRYKEAIPLLNRLQAVRGGKDRAVAQTAAAAYRKSGDMEGALRVAKEFAAKTPGDAESVLSVIYLAIDSKDRATTQNYIVRLEKIAPASPLPDYYRGLLALSDTKRPTLERLQTGERFFQKSVDRAPEEAMLRAQLGYSQLGQGKDKLDAARSNLTAAVLYANHDPVARRGLALVAEQEKFWEDAAAQYEAVLAITPDDNDSRRRFAGVLLYADRKEEAYRQFYTLATRLPKDTVYLRELASFFVRDKQHARARGAYEQVLERDPKNVAAMLEIAQTFVSEKKSAEARAAFERTLTADPKNETAYLLLAQLFVDDDREADAVRTLERLLVAVPGSNAGRWQLIERYIRDKKDDDARREIAKLTLRRGDPHRNRYRMATGNLHAVRERWTEAVSEFERLGTEEPDNPDFASALADAYGKAGRKEDAVATYAKAARLAEKVLTSSPDDRDARAVLIHARGAQKNPEAATNFLKNLDGAAAAARTGGG